MRNGQYSYKLQSISDEELPAQDDIPAFIDLFKEKTEKWLKELDYDADNILFKWAGKTKTGIVIFLFRHIMYNMGELNPLLYRSKNGHAYDNWMKGFE